jgi:hypothetical protein
MSRWPLRISPSIPNIVRLKLKISQHMACGDSLVPPRRLDVNPVAFQPHEVLSGVDICRSTRHYDAMYKRGVSANFRREWLWLLNVVGYCLRIGRRDLMIGGAGAPLCSPRALALTESPKHKPGLALYRRLRRRCRRLERSTSSGAASSRQSCCRAAGTGLSRSRRPRSARP